MKSFKTLTRRKPGRHHVTFVVLFWVFGWALNYLVRFSSWFGLKPVHQPNIVHVWTLRHLTCLSLKSRDKCLKQTALTEKKKTCFDAFFIFKRPFLLFFAWAWKPRMLFLTCCSLYLKSLTELSATLFLCRSPFPLDLYSASSDGRVVLYPKDIIAFWEGQMTKDQINHNTKLISERTVARWWAMTPCTSATTRCGSVNTAS